MKGASFLSPSCPPSCPPEGQAALVSGVAYSLLSKCPQSPRQRGRDLGGRSSLAWIEPFSLACQPERIVSDMLEEGQGRMRLEGERGNPKIAAGVSRRAYLLCTQFNIPINLWPGFYEPSNELGRRRRLLLRGTLVHHIVSFQRKSKCRHNSPSKKQPVWTQIPEMDEEELIRLGVL